MWRNACLLPALIAFWGPVRGSGPAEPGPLVAATKTVASGEKHRFHFGGHLKLRAGVSWPHSDSLWGLADADPFYDGFMEARLKGTWDGPSGWQAEIHYENIRVGRDFWEASQSFAGFGSIAGGVVDDAARALDLTSVLDRRSDGVWYHRLDRFHVTRRFDWGMVRLGRQALTWGNGMIFNPMDLFNPFSPTEIERDYKVGDDLLLVQAPLGSGELQAIAVPRRDAAHDLASERSSFAAKYHLQTSAVEWDFVAASHYDGIVLGLGSQGYLGSAAWRMDGTWTDPGGAGRSYAALVADLDYSWVWGGRNLYGLVEYHHNGQPRGSYLERLQDPYLQDRLGRGESFTLGRHYLAGSLTLELHPLVQFSAALIENLEDPSGFIQPRLTWSLAEDLELLVSGSVTHGARNTEFGGVVLPLGPSFEVTTAAPDVFSIRLTWFF